MGLLRMFPRSARPEAPSAVCLPIRLTISACPAPAEGLALDCGGTFELSLGTVPLFFFPSPVYPTSLIPRFPSFSLLLPPVLFSSLFFFSLFFPPTSCPPFPPPLYLFSPFPFSSGTELSLQLAGQPHPSSLLPRGTGLY